MVRLAASLQHQWYPQITFRIQACSTRVYYITPTQAAVSFAPTPELMCAPGGWAEKKDGLWQFKNKQNLSDVWAYDLGTPAHFPTGPAVTSTREEAFILLSSPAETDKAQGACGLSLQAVSVWAGWLFVCSGSERLIIPLAPVTHPALCHQQLPGHIRDRWGECFMAEQSSMYRLQQCRSHFLGFLKSTTSKFPPAKYCIWLRY